MAANRVGKTFCGGAECAFHLSGDYPSWWKGRTFNKPSRMWAASETSEMTAAGVQAALCGRIEDGIGTGAIPKALIYDAKPKRSAAAGSLEYVVVRFGVGGDTQGGFSYCGFKSYDQGRAKFQADTLDIVWLDEEPDSSIYFEALTRISTTDGIVMMTFTPLKGASMIVRRFMPKPWPGTSVTSMTIDDAEHFDEAKRAELEQRYPEHEREARLRGIPQLGSGVIFPVQEDQIKVARFKIPTHWPQLSSIDFGHFDHPTAAVGIAIDPDAGGKDGIFYVHRAYRERRVTPVMASSVLRHWGAGWMPWAWPHDGLQHDRGNSGLQVAQHYADQGLLMLAEHAKFEDETISVEPGLTQMLDAMLAGTFKVFDDLGDWFDEFRMYHRVDGKIVKEQDDLMSATRYGWMARRFARVRPRASKFKHEERRRHPRVT